jgi:hypothetical protein
LLTKGPVARGDYINEVTAGQVGELVEEAYKEARLDKFDRLPFEMWSHDRLTVFVLRQARFHIAPYFDGVGAKGPSEDDLRKVFLKSAQEVYARALEMAEVMGVSHSFDRFIAKIYETSASGDESLTTTGADYRYERMMSGVLDKPWLSLLFFAAGEKQASGPLSQERQYQLRFRARRALYDCLSSGYERLLNGDRGVPVGNGNSSSRVPDAKTEALPEGVRVVTVTSELWGKVALRVNNECHPEVENALAKPEPQSVRFDFAQLEGRGGGAPMPVYRNGQ